MEDRAELRAVVNSAEVPATVATRARIVLWRAEKRLKKEIAALAGVSQALDRTQPLLPGDWQQTRASRSTSPRSDRPG